MTYPQNTAAAITAAYPDLRPFDDWQVGQVPHQDGLQILFWKPDGAEQPTPDQVNAWLSDAEALPTGQLFSEAAGEADNKRKRQAALQLMNDEGLRVLLRAMAGITQKELRGLKPGGTPRPNKTLAEVEAELVADILSGAADDPPPA